MPTTCSSQCPCEPRSIYSFLYNRGSGKCSLDLLEKSFTDRRISTMTMTKADITKKIADDCGFMEAEASR